MKSVQFYGKTLANNLVPALAAEQEKYRAEIAQYQAEKEAFDTALKAYMALDEAARQDAKKPKEPKKPEYPSIDSQRMQARSEWSRFVADFLTQADEYKNATASINGQTLSLSFDKNYETWALELGDLALAQSNTRLDAKLP